MLARLLAIADDIDTCVFLPLDGKQCGVEFCRGKVASLQAPLWP
jgi:hypothetical protein